MCKRIGALMVLWLSALIMTGCGMVPDIPDIPAIGEGEDVSDDITHTLTIKYDLATYSLYSSTVAYEDAKEAFALYLEDEGYQEAGEEVDQAFFIQYGDGTSAGGTVYEDEDHYLYVYVTGGEDSASVYTVGTTKDNYEGYKEGDLDEGQIDDEDDDDSAGIPDEDTAAGEELPAMDRYPGAVMVEHLKVTQEGETEFLIEYQVEADWQAVFEHYKDELEANWDLDDWETWETGEDTGGKLIAYYGDDYGLTLTTTYEDEEEGIVLIHIYASEYHD